MMGPMSKRAMRRERRRTAARLRAAEKELAELRAEFAERRKHWDSTLLFYRQKTEEARQRAANRLHGNIPVVSWPFTVSP